MSQENPAGVAHDEWSFASLTFVIGVLIVTSAVIVLSTAPFVKLLGTGAYATAAALHGIIGFAYLVASTVGLYLAWRLFLGKIHAFADLKLLTLAMAVLSLVTICLGNWAYIGYRASAPDSPKTWLVANAPGVHEVFFEFKEYAALFTLPLAAAAAFILWHYGRQVLERTWLRYGVSFLITLHFFYFALAFGLGAAITKVRSL